jgi:hypothetical protein
MTFIKRFWEDVYPGRSAKLLWDNNNMRITNLMMINQFVKKRLS